MSTNREVPFLVLPPTRPTLGQSRHLSLQFQLEAENGLTARPLQAADVGGTCRPAFSSKSAERVLPCAGHVATSSACH